MEKFIILLEDLNACQDSRRWAGDMTIEEVVQACPRGDWLLWLAGKINIDQRKLTLAKAACAKTIIPLIEDKRSLEAIRIAELYGSNLTEEYELILAKRKAIEVATESAVALKKYSELGANESGYSVLDINYYSAHAAYNCANLSIFSNYDTAAYTADAAYAYEIVPHGDFVLAKNKQKENQLQTADICREILGKLIINRVNALLNKSEKYKSEGIDASK